VLAAGRPAELTFDPAVAHIEQIESANRYWMAQLEVANEELVRLKA